MMERRASLLLPLLVAGFVVCGGAGAAERDSDGDGVIDLRDRCPGSAHGLQIDATGCELDSDSDGVLESRDRCPGTARGDPVDAAGCSRTLRLGIVFETNSTRWTEDSVPELERALALLTAVPEARAVIETHTDSSGSTRRNLELSRQRALAICDYLVERGIERARLSAKGFGESQPIADESTPEGRAQNRRVILRRLDVS